MLLLFFIALLFPVRLSRSRILFWETNQIGIKQNKSEYIKKKRKKSRRKMPKINIADRQMHA